MGGLFSSRAQESRLKLNRITPDDIVSYYTQEVRVPSCSVALVKDGKTTFSGDPHAVYRVASLTKLYLHPLYLRLHEDGRINLEASVRSTAPFDLPAAYDAVTLRDLLESRSGLPLDFLNPANPFAWHRALNCGLFGTNIYAQWESLEGFAKGFGYARTLRCLRHRRPLYSNFGFALLTLCVEQMTGCDINDLFLAEIARPYGLQETAFQLTGEAASRIQPSCAGKLPWLVRRGRPVNPHPLPRALRGSGGLLSSTADCASFFDHNWEIVDELVRDCPVTSCADGEDLGLLRVKVLPSGDRILYRFGMIYGGSSFVCYQPESRLILLILRNVTSWPAAEDFLLADRLLRTMARE